MRCVVILVSLMHAAAAAATSDWIPFDRFNGHITIPVTLNGQPASAILDTGASGNAISEHYLKKVDVNYQVGRKIFVRGVYGNRRVRLVNGMKVGMFGTEYEIDNLMPMNIQAYDVLVGLPFFEKHIVQIDYPGSRLRLIEHDDVDLRETANVKMRRARGGTHPVVKVDLNGEYEPWVTLDTGNNGSLVLPRPDVERLGWLQRYDVSESQSLGVNGILTDTQRFKLPMMRIGPHTLENVSISVPAAGERSNIGRSWRRSVNSSDGILGHDVLRHFVVTIDYRRRLLHLAAPE